MKDNSLNSAKTENGMGVITLSTDFGLQDGYAGILKGVILGIAPHARVVDLSHAIPAQDVRCGALLLRRAWRYFPIGSVHLAVVDPGVGTSRRPLALALGKSFAVGPDNGLFTLLLEDAARQRQPVTIVHLTEPRFWLAHVSATFHGRDIFAPIAAHLVNGVPIETMGDVIHDPVLLEFPHPERRPGGWRAHITGVDVFGNLATDLPAEELISAQLRICLRGHEIRALASAYGAAATGELIALADSTGMLEIAVVDGSAVKTTGADIGEIVDVFLA